MADLSTREATIDDCSVILQFIRELAAYEKAENEVVATEADVQASLFGEDSIAKAIICELNHQPIGFAVYFYNYSTWLAENGLYLEDLYVTTDKRGIGAGKALLKHLTQLAKKNNCRRFEWSVLDWNQPAIDFYQSIGAEPQSEWIKYRLSGRALEHFAS